MNITRNGRDLKMRGEVLGYTETGQWNHEWVALSILEHYSHAWAQKVNLGFFHFANFSLLQPHISVIALLKYPQIRPFPPLPTSYKQIKEGPAFGAFNIDKISKMCDFAPSPKHVQKKRRFPNSEWIVSREKNTILSLERCAGGVCKCSKKTLIEASQKRLLLPIHISLP